MQYEKEIILKDGAKCLLRGAGEADAAEVLRTFDLTHAETDYLLTYPEENSFTVQDEAKMPSKLRRSLTAGLPEQRALIRLMTRKRFAIVRTSASPLKKPTGGAASGRLLRLRALNARSKRDTCK